MVLEQAGFFVTPAFGFTEASKVCRLDHLLDLVVMDHSMPRDDKTALIGMLRPNCKAWLLSIHRHIDQPIPEADFSVDSFDGPEGLLAAVKNALGIRAPKPVSSASISSSEVAESSKKRQ